MTDEHGKFHTRAGTLSFTKAACESIEETGIDPADDVERLLDGRVTIEALLAECLDGAEDDRVQGWREYVRTLEAAVGREMLTLIEYMPAYLRESHLAARNKGVWPANGSVRVYVIGEITDAQLDPDWADVIKTIEAAELPDGADVLADIPEDALRSVPDEEREP